MHNEYGYNKMNISAQTGITTWRCAHQQSHRHLNCRAKAYTKQFGLSERVKVSGEHTHPAKLPLDNKLKGSRKSGIIKKNVKQSTPQQLGDKESNNSPNVHINL